MCQHPTRQVNVSRKGVLCAPDSRKFFETPCIIRTLKEDQPLRLLLNLLFYHFNRSDPTYKSQRIKLSNVTAAFNQLNVNALNKIFITSFSWGDLTDCISLKVDF